MKQTKQILTTIFSILLLFVLTNNCYAQSSSNSLISQAGGTKVVEVRDNRLNMTALTCRVPSSWKVAAKDLSYDSTIPGTVAIRIITGSPDGCSKFNYIQKPAMQANLSGENVVTQFLKPQLDRAYGHTKLLKKEFSQPQSNGMATTFQFLAVFEYSKNGKKIHEANAGTVGIVNGAPYSSIILNTYAQPATTMEDLHQKMMQFFSTMKPNPQWEQALQQQAMQQMQQYQQQNQQNPYQQQYQQNPYQQQYQQNPYLQQYQQNPYQQQYPQFNPYQ